MGFPHDFHFPSDVGNIDSLHMCGNAIAVPVLEHLFRVLLPIVNLRGYDIA